MSDRLDQVRPFPNPNLALEKTTQFHNLRKSVLHAATIYLSTWRPASVPIGLLRANAEVESCVAHAWFGASLLSYRTAQGRAVV